MRCFFLLKTIDLTHTPLRAINLSMKNCIASARNPKNEHFCTILTFVPGILLGCNSVSLAPIPNLLFTLHDAQFIGHYRNLLFLRATARALGYSAPHEPYSGAHRRAPRRKRRVRDSDRALSGALLLLGALQR